MDNNNSSRRFRPQVQESWLYLSNAWGGGVVQRGDGTLAFKQLEKRKLCNSMQITSYFSSQRKALPLAVNHTCYHLNAQYWYVQFTDKPTWLQSNSNSLLLCFFGRKQNDKPIYHFMKSNSKHSSCLSQKMYA